MAKIQIENLKCEYETTPMGVQNSHPQPTVPLNNDSLDGAKMILLGNVRTGEEEIEVDLCEPIPLTVGDSRLYRRQERRWRS